MTRLVAIAILVVVGALGLAALATWWSFRILGNPDATVERPSAPLTCSHIDGCRADCPLYAPTT